VLVELVNNVMNFLDDVRFDDELIDFEVRILEHVDSSPSVSISNNVMKKMILSDVTTEQLIRAIKETLTNEIIAKLTLERLLFVSDFHCIFQLINNQQLHGLEKKS
jgi:ribonucleotide reductase beta subunit family protein with ferritin-like domain